MDGENDGKTLFLNGWFGGTTTTIFGNTHIGFPSKKAATLVQKNWDHVISSPKVQLQEAEDISVVSKGNFRNFPTWKPNGENILSKQKKENIRAIEKGVYKMKIATQGWICS